MGVTGKAGGGVDTTNGGVLLTEARGVLQNSGLSLLNPLDLELRNVG